MLTKRVRYAASALGALIGDIRAAQFEHKRKQEVLTIISAQGGVYPVDYVDPWEKNPEKRRIIDKDQPTDDSELFAALGLALASSYEFNPEAIYNAARRFIVDRVPVLSKKPFGSGTTLRSALEPESYELSLRKFGRGEVIVQPANGGLMRNTAIYLRYQGDEDALVRYARWQSCITHMHPLSQAACMAHAVWGSQVLDGLNPVDAWGETVRRLSDKKYKKVPELGAVLALEPTEPSQDLLWPGGEDHTGHVGLSLQVALWATCTACSYRDGIEKCIIIGGDTDTYAAIAGGVLGAHFGLADVPQDWFAAAQGSRVVVELADKLYDFAHR